MKNTYIYIKESPKGLKYLGKTVRDPYTYLGSGTRWKLHLKKNGYTHKDLTTTILYETTDKEKLTEVGLYYSKLFNVVESKDWANLMDEKGDGGGSMAGKKHKESTKKLQAMSKIGDLNPAKRPEVIAKIRESKLGVKHSEESNRKRSKTLSGRKRPVEVVEKIKKGLTGRKLSNSHIESLKGPRKPYGKQPTSKCKYCGIEGGRNSISRWHNENCKHK